MSVSTRTAPAQIGFGGIKSALAAMALVVIIAAAVAFAATRTAPAATITQANPVPVPAYLDKGSRAEQVLPAIPFVDRDKDLTLNLGTSTHPYNTYGGWGGPRLTAPDPGKGGNGTRLA